VACIPKAPSFFYAPPHAGVFFGATSVPHLLAAALTSFRVSKEGRKKKKKRGGGGDLRATQGEAPGSLSPHLSLRGRGGERRGGERRRGHARLHRARDAGHWNTASLSLSLALLSLREEGGSWTDRERRGGAGGSEGAFSDSRREGLKREHSLSTGAGSKLITRDASRAAAHHKARKGV